MSSVERHEVAAGPPPLTVRGVPSDPNLRVLALATLVNTVGNGALTTTFALYFTHVVGLRAPRSGWHCRWPRSWACWCRCRWVTSATCAARGSCCAC